ncbi:MAG: hypothetical protein ACRD5L_14490, partial [Bryobacteraceae bacterium]
MALLTPNVQAANTIERLANESGVFNIVLRGEPLPPASHIVRTLGIHGPELVLLDLRRWDSVSHIARKIKEGNLGTVVIGFRATW